MKAWYNKMRLLFFVSLAFGVASLFHSAKSPTTYAILPSEQTNWFVPASGPTEQPDYQSSEEPPRTYICSNEVTLRLGQKMKFILEDYDPYQKVVYIHNPELAHVDEASGTLILDAGTLGAHTALVVFEENEGTRQSCLIKLRVI